MEKYITSLKDLVIQVMTNGAEIKDKAEKGDAKSCFQIGMIYLLGVGTSIDFKKSSVFLGNQSLSGNSDAHRLLGFIAECEGQYSQAFSYYAKAGKGNGRYVNKVFEERSNFLKFLKEFGLSGIVLNKEITSMLNDCIAGGIKSLDAKRKLAYICEDETTCLEVAQSEYDEGDFSSAMDWLLRGKVAQNNTLYIDVEKKLSNTRRLLAESKIAEVIEIEGGSLFAANKDEFHYDELKAACEVASSVCINNWYEKIPLIVNEETSRIKKQQEAETARLRKQQEADAEAARLRKQQEAEAEAARLRKQQEEEKAARLRKQQEEETARLRKQEEERMAMLPLRRKKIYKRYNIVFSILALPFVIVLLVAMFTVKENSFVVNVIICSIIFAVMVLLPYKVGKWAVKKIYKL